MTDTITINDVHLGPQEINLGALSLLLCDIDGTLADITHRRHFVATKPKNWAAFEKLASKDLPFWDIINAVNSVYAAGAKVILVSGRGDHQRETTERWLKAHTVRYNSLLMRKSGDHRDDDIVKQEILNDIRVKVGNPDLVLDDRNRVVDMWRRNGIRTIQVAEGDF